MKSALRIRPTASVDEPDYYVEVQRGTRGSFHWKIRVAGLRRVIARSRNPFSSQAKAFEAGREALLRFMIRRTP